MRNLDELMKTLPAKRRTAIEQHARQKVAALRLQQAREMQGVTQQQLAARLHITQPALSRMERREDVLVSNLMRYAAALGAGVEITLTLAKQPNDKRARKIRLLSAVGSA